MGIDIEIRGASRKDYIGGMKSGVFDGSKPVLDGNDWMGLKNCTFLDRFLSEHSHADAEVLTAWEKCIYPSDPELSKPFTLQDMRDAVERLAKLDRDVAAVADTADGRQKVSRLVLDVYGDRDGIRLFVFPWDNDYMEKFKCASGAWPLSDIIKRAIANAEKMPPDTVYFLLFC